MPFICPPSEIAQTRRRRLLIVGKSGSRKTTALLTAPKPIAIINFPGELGYDTVPDNDPDIYKRAWADESSKSVSAGKTIKAVEEEALSIIASGKYKSIFLEGLHHFTSLCLDDVTDGAYLSGAEFEPKLYGLAYRMVFDHIARLSNTMTPVVGWTCWAEMKAERSKRPGEKADDIPKKVLPALPGQLPHQIRGRFSVMLYQSLHIRKDKQQSPVKNERGEIVRDAYWQTRDTGDILCAGLKGPASVVEKIPTLIPADYRAFEAAWDKAADKATHITQAVPQEVSK